MTPLVSKNHLPTLRDAEPLQKETVQKHVEDIERALSSEDQEGRLDGDVSSVCLPLAFQYLDGDAVSFFVADYPAPVVSPADEAGGDCPAERARIGPRKIVFLTLCGIFSC